MTVYTACLIVSVSFQTHFAGLQTVIVLVSKYCTVLVHSRTIAHISKHCSKNVMFPMPPFLFCGTHSLSRALLSCLPSSCPPHSSFLPSLLSSLPPPLPHIQSFSLALGLCAVFLFPVLTPSALQLSSSEGRLISEHVSATRLKPLTPEKQQRL